MLWLGEKRGYLTDWITQRWVCLTRRRIDLEYDTWLNGMIGKTTGIGKDYFYEFARTMGLEVRPQDMQAGLIQDFDVLIKPSTSIQPGVKHFYEHTAAYDLDAWSQWSGIFRPFGGLLAALFSRRLQQLNVPLSSLDTSRGVTSRIIQLTEPVSGDVLYTTWVRQFIGNGNVLYAGSYSVCTVPGYHGYCIKVVFPLPNGNGIVIMKPTVDEEGSMTISSSGQQFGDPGFYFTVHLADGRIFARYVRSLRESIHVYESDEQVIRADHVLTLWGITFLRLHYRLRLRENIDFMSAS